MTPTPSWTTLNGAAARRTSRLGRSFLFGVTLFVGLAIFATGMTPAVGAQPGPPPEGVPLPIGGGSPTLPVDDGGVPVPPARFYGTVRLNDRPAPVGTTIVARIGATTCATTQVVQEGQYFIDVPGAGSVPGCGTEGATVTFVVNGVVAGQTGSWRQGQIIPLNLAAGGLGFALQPLPPLPSPSSIVLEVRTQFCAQLFRAVLTVQPLSLRTRILAQAGCPTGPVV